MPAPRPFTFTLTSAEKARIVGMPNGTGGQQSLRILLIGKLGTGNVIELTDAEYGRVTRYMSFYGQGGFQDALKAAFTRSIKELIS